MSEIYLPSYHLLPQDTKQNNKNDLLCYIHLKLKIFLELTNYSLFKKILTLAHLSFVIYKTYMI